MLMLTSSCRYMMCDINADEAFGLFLAEGPGWWVAVKTVLDNHQWRPRKWSRTDVFALRSDATVSFYCRHVVLQSVFHPPRFLPNSPPTRNSRCSHTHPGIPRCTNHLPDWSHKDLRYIARCRFCSRLNCSPFCQGSCRWPEFHAQRHGRRRRSRGPELGWFRRWVRRWWWGRKPRRWWWRWRRP